MPILRTALALLLLLLATATCAQTTLPAGYDVILLVGQSNMVGYGTGPDNAADAAVDPRIFQWDGVNNVVIPAVDPLVQNQAPAWVGPGLTFAKAYLKTLPANRKILLVGAAAGGTNFLSGAWLPPSGNLVVTALQRANAAMAAAGTGARFAGILWHQGESDILTNTGLYQEALVALIGYFRASITGASSTTPFVVGEFSYGWMQEYLLVPTLAPMMQVFHTLPDIVPYTAWVSAGGLAGDVQNGIVHFSALSQRQFGRRYADKFFEATHNLPQPEVSQKYWAGTFLDDGRSYPNGQYPVNLYGTVYGTVTPVEDPVRGVVASISAGGGAIAYQVPGTLFNASYTKMAWIKTGAANYYNVLLGANNPGQTHFLLAATFDGVLTVAAGHSASTPTVTVSTTLPAQTGVWINVAVAYDAGAQTMTLYVNGAPAATASKVAPAPALATATAPLVMGSLGNIPGSGVDGAMAGNRAWNVALDPAQIAAIYNFEVSDRAGF